MASLTPGTDQGPNQGPDQGPNQGPNQDPDQGSNQGPNQGPDDGTNNGQHLEVEIKLEAPAGAELPDLSTLPGVATVVAEATDELDAVYFDASDLRLIRAGITLRRRSGGHDEGWHLKLPPLPEGTRVAAQNNTDVQPRLEVHRPLGAQPRVVPAPLLALVRARLLGEPLAPVAHIRTTRARYGLHSPEGARLAEVADDTVTAEAYTQPDVMEEEQDEELEKGADEAVLLRWHEFEVELDQGDRDLLDHARVTLLATVAKEAPSPSKLARTLAERLRAEQPEPEPKNRGAAKPVVERLRAEADRLVALDPRVRLGTEGAVDELRTAVRAIDGLLIVFAELFEPEPTEALRRELTRLGSVLERLHETERVREQLLTRVGQQPDEVVIGPVRERIDTELGQGLRQARIELVQELNAPGHLALLRRLGAFVTTPPMTEIPLDSQVKRRKALLGALTPSVTRAHQKIMIDDDVSSAAEQARLAAEALLPVAGRKVGEYLEAARTVETAAGEAVEHERARRTLLTLARRATRAGESAFTYGHLYAGLGPAPAGPDLTRLAEAAERWPLDGPE